MSIKVYNNYIYFPFEERPLNQIHTIKNALNPNDINKLLELMKNVSLIDGIVGDKNSNLNVTNNKRSSKVYWIPINDTYMWLYKKIIPIVLKANKKLWNFDIVGANIPIQYTEYDAIYKGHYDWHVDIGNTNNSKRKISITIQLSTPEDYQGGNLTFFNKPNASRDIGSMTIFPSYLLHKVEPILYGTRKCIVLWLCGPPFR